MTTQSATANTDLPAFKKLVKIMKKTEKWGDNPEFDKITEDLATNTSKEAQEVRNIIWRMVKAEVKSKDR